MQEQSAVSNPQSPTPSPDQKEILELLLAEQLADSQADDEEDDLEELEDDLDALDELLADSLVEATARKKARLAKAFRRDDEPLADIPHVWRKEFTCAVLIEHQCRCGETQVTFSHFAEFHSFVGRHNPPPAPTKWVKVSAEPRDPLAAPRVVLQPCPACPSCLTGLGRAVAFGQQEVPSRQYTIIDTLRKFSATA